jgi:hypothetical protein
VTYALGGKLFHCQSSMVTLGADPVRTAMAKTVGLATGIGAKLILQGDITRRGVVIPTVGDVYGPVLAELRNFGIRFEEETVALDD